MLSLLFWTGMCYYSSNSGTGSNSDYTAPSSNSVSGSAQSFVTKTFYNSTLGTCDEAISSHTSLSDKSCVEGESWEVPIGNKWADCIKSGSVIPYDHKKFCAPNNPKPTPAPNITPAPTAACGVTPGHRCCWGGPVPNGVVNNNGDCQYEIPGTQYLELTVSEHRGLLESGLESGCSSHNASNSPTTTWQIPLGSCFVHNGWTPSLVSTQATDAPTRAFKVHCIESTGELEVIEYIDTHCNRFHGSSTVQKDECVNGDKLGHYWATVSDHKWRTCNDSFFITKIYGRELEGDHHHFDSLSTGCMKFCGTNTNCNFFTFGTEATTGAKVCELYSECRHPSISRLQAGWNTMAVDRRRNPINGTLFYHRAKYSYRGCDAVLASPVEDESSQAMFLIAAASSFVMLVLVFCAWRLLRHEKSHKEGKEGKQKGEKGESGQRQAQKEGERPGHVRIPSGSVVRLDGNGTPSVQMVAMSPDGHLRVVSQPVMMRGSEIVYDASGQNHVRHISMPSPVGGFHTPVSGNSSPANGHHLRVLSAPGISYQQPSTSNVGRARSMDFRGQQRLPMIGENGSTSYAGVQGEPENPHVIDPWLQLQNGGGGLAQITPEAFSRLPTLTQEYLKHWAATSLQAHSQFAGHQPIPKIQIMHPQRGSWIDGPTLATQLSTSTLGGPTPTHHSGHPSYSSSISSPMPMYSTRTTPPASMGGVAPMAQFPPQTVAQLPPQTVAQLPPHTLAQFSPYTVAQLTPEGVVWNQHSPTFVHPSPSYDEKAPHPPQYVATGGVGVGESLEPPKRKGPPPAYESPNAEAELTQRYLQYHRTGPVPVDPLVEDVKEPLPTPSPPAVDFRAAPKIERGIDRGRGHTTDADANGAVPEDQKTRTQSDAAVSPAPGRDSKVSIKSRRTKSSASTPIWEEWNPEAVQRADDSKKASRKK